MTRARIPMWCTVCKAPFQKGEQIMVYLTKEMQVLGAHPACFDSKPELKRDARAAARRPTP